VNRVPMIANFNLFTTLVRHMLMASFIIGASRIMSTSPTSQVSEQLTFSEHVKHKIYLEMLPKNGLSNTHMHIAVNNRFVACARAHAWADEAHKW